MIRYSLICVFLVACCTPTWAEEPAKPDVKKLAREVGAATLAGDYAKVIDLTYPTLVKKLGGRKQAIQFFAITFKSLSETGFKFEKYEIGTPGKPYVRDKKTFIVVPITITVSINMPKRLLEVKSYLLAISTDQCKTWTFVDESGLEDKELRDKLLPKLPKELKLPEPTEPVLIPKN